VIGVIQLINKSTGGGVFTSDDEDVMAIFLSIAGPILADSTLYEKIQGKSKGRATEGTGEENEMATAGKPDTTVAHTKAMPGFAEEGEDEDDEY
jgi:hypothetical protein